MTQESPIFAKAYDFLLWLLPATARFPKPQRFVLARQIEDAAFAFHRELLAARASDGARLAEADRWLAALRTYLRLACDLRYVSVGQYEHGARLADELGRLLGGWKRRAARPTEAPTAREGRDVGVGYRPAGRVVEQQPDQPAGREPRQQPTGEPQHEHRLSVRE